MNKKTFKMMNKQTFKLGYCFISTEGEYQFRPLTRDMPTYRYHAEEYESPFDACEEFKRQFEKDEILRQTIRVVDSKLLDLETSYRDRAIDKNSFIEQYASFLKEKQEFESIEKNIDVFQAAKDEADRIDTPVASSGVFFQRLDKENRQLQLRIAERGRQNQLFSDFTQGALDESEFRERYMASLKETELFANEDLINKAVEGAIKQVKEMPDKDKTQLRLISLALGALQSICARDESFQTPPDSPRDPTISDTASLGELKARANSPR